MFEIKYDRDGHPIRNPEVEQQIKEENVDNARVDNTPPKVVEEVTEEAPIEQEEEEKTLQQEEPEKVEDPVSINLKNLREAKEKAERERDEFRNYFMQMQQQNMPKQAPQEEDIYKDLGVGEDDLVEGKHYAKMAKEMRELKKEINEYKQKSEIATAESQIRSAYPDFDEIITKENVSALAEADPELAQSFASIPDSKLRALTVYKYLKKSMTTLNPVRKNNDAVLIKKNIAKPRPLASVSPQEGDSPLGHANAFAEGLTDELAKKLRAEMVAAIKRRNN